MTTTESLNSDYSASSDIEELIKESNKLILDLGWDESQAREHLLDEFNKKSRLLLTADEWADYLKNLKTQVACLKAFPSYYEKDLIALAQAEYKRLNWDRKKQILELMKNSKNSMSLQSLQPSDLKSWINYLRSLPVKTQIKEE